MADDSMRKAFLDTQQARAQTNQANMAGPQALGRGIAEGVQSVLAIQYRAQQDELYAQQQEQEFNQKALAHDLEQRQLMLEQQKHIDFLNVAHAENGIKAAVAQTRAQELMNRREEQQQLQDFRNRQLEDMEMQTGIKAFRVQSSQLGRLRPNPDTQEIETYQEDDSPKGFGYHGSKNKSAAQRKRDQKLYDIQQLSDAQGSRRGLDQERVDRRAAQADTRQIETARHNRAMEAARGDDEETRLQKAYARAQRAVNDANTTYGIDEGESGYENLQLARQVVITTHQALTDYQAQKKAQGEQKPDVESTDPSTPFTPKQQSAYDKLRKKYPMLTDADLRKMVKELR